MPKFLQVLVVSSGLLILVAGIASLYVSFRLSALKTQLAESLSHELNAEVTIGSLSLDPWQCLFIANDVTLINTDTKKPWSKASVQEAEASYHYMDFVHQKLPLEVRLNHWNLSLRLDSSHNSGPILDALTFDTAPPSTPAEPPPGIQIAALAADSGHIELIFSAMDSAECNGVNIKAQHYVDDVWIGTANAESFKILSLKEDPFNAYDLSAKLRLTSDHFELNKIDCQCRPGEITGSVFGWLEENPGFDDNLSFQQLPLAPILPQAWEGKVLGLASGRIHYSDRGGHVIADGHVKVDQCVFNLFPVVTTVTHWLQTSDFGSLTLDHAESSFTYDSGAISLTDLDLQKQDVVAVAGNVNVDKLDVVDGHLQIGVPTYLTSKWPSLEDEIFVTDRNECHWADVHVSGTLSQPREDLTPRLEKLAGAQGKGLINTTANKALDWLGNLMGK